MPPCRPTFEQSKPGVTQCRVAAARAAIENLRPQELAAELAAGHVVLVDVRSADEQRGGVIDGARTVPRGTIELQSEQLGDAATRIVVYCDTGARSALAAAALYDLGFVDVAHLDGGLVAWRAQGRPVTTPTGE